MFYTPGSEPEKLTHNPFKAIVSPRPIAWVSTVGSDGIYNLAPFSFFNAISDTPPMVAFAPNGKKPNEGNVKDTLFNIRENSEFVINIVGKPQLDAMNISSQPFPIETCEFTKAALKTEASHTVSVPRVKNIPAALECHLWKEIALPGDDNHLVIAEVTGIYIDPNMITDGKYDLKKSQPVSRLGYMDYTIITDSFELKRPSI